MSATILVVDDDENFRELLSLHLRGAGYDVLLAEDAIFAGQFFLERRRVDLLIADIEMPFMDGLDLVRAIRNDPEISSLPVIFATSHPEHEKTAAELGAVAYLQKPLRAEVVLATVAKHLGNRLPA
jgi:CheY-like chemotaxis protein